jgi:hypothetical protein
LSSRFTALATTSAVDPYHVDADSDSTDHPVADPDSDFIFYVDPDADPDPTFHSDADPDPDPSFQIKAQTLKKCSNRHILACDLQIDADLDTVPDQAYHFDSDPDFYLMRMRIHADPDRDPQHWLQRSFGGFLLLTGVLRPLAFSFTS